LGLDVGTVTGKVQFDLATSALTEAVTKLADVATALTRTGDRAKDSGSIVEAAYRKLAASLDPVVAGQQRYERAQQTLDAALSKGLISQDQYTQALDRAREKFTSTEQNATSLRTKLDELAHSVDGFGQHLNELGEKFESVKSFGEGLKEKLLELAAVVGVGLSLDKIIEDTVASQDAQAQLAAGLKATGAATGETKAKLDALADSLLGTTKFSRTTIEQAESLGLTFTHISADAFPRFLQSAADIAARTGTDLPTAVEKLGRALDTGMVAPLKRAGITFDQTTQAQAKFFAETGQYSKAIALILGGVEAKLAGSAEAARNTLGGAFQLLRNEFEEVAISIGTALTPALKILVQDLSDGARLSGNFAESIGGALATALHALDEVLVFVRDHSELLKATLAAVITYETITLLVSFKTALVAATEAEGLLALLNPFALAIAGAAALIVYLHSINDAVRATQQQFEAERGGDRLLQTLLSSTKALTAEELAHAQQVIETNKRYAEQLEIQLKIADAAVDAERKSISFLQDFKDGWQQVKNFASGGFLSGINAAQQAPQSHTDSAAEQKAHALQDTLISVNKTIEASEARLKSLGEATDKTGTDAVHFAEHFNSAAQAVQAYADKLFDLTNKLLNAGANQSKLLSALGEGEIAYNLQKAALERSNAIEQTTVQLEKDHRELLEKLTAEIDKAKAALSEKHGVDQAASAAIREGNAALEAANKNYPTTSKALSDLAAKNVDWATAEKQRLFVLQANRVAQEAYDAGTAKLKDTIDRTTAATQAHAAQLNVEHALLALSKIGLKDLDGSIEANIRARDAQTNSLHAQIDIQRQINALADQTANVRAAVDDWNAQRAAVAQYGAEVAGILKQYGLLSAATQERAADEAYLRALEHGASFEQAKELYDAIKGQQEIVNGLHAIQAATDIAVRHYKDFADQLAQNFAGIFADFIKTGKLSLDSFETATVDAFASVAEKIIRGWLTQWFEAMAQWLVRWIATQAAAKAAQAGLGSGGGYSVSNAGNFGGGFTSLGSGGGGYAGLVGTAGTAGVAGSGSGAAGLFSGTGSAGALGAVGAWAAVLVVFGLLVNSLNDHLQKTKESIIQFDESLNVATSTGDNKTIGLITAGQALAKQVKSFFDAFGGIFQGLDASIGIKHRGQGSNSEWKVYVDGLMTNFGRDMEAALNYALIESIRHTSSIGLDPLVVAAIHDYTGKSLDEFKAQVEFAQRLATQNLPGVSGQVASAASQYFADLHQAQTTFKDDATALDTAIASITRKFSDTVQALKNSALGIDTSTADFLASLAAFDDQMKKGAAAQRKDIEDRIAATEQEIKALGNGPRLSKGSDADERSAAKTKWDETIATLRHQIDVYTAELAKIPTQLSDSEISMAIFDSLYKYLDGSAKYAEQAHKYAVLKVELEFAAIQAQLVALGRWEEFAGMFADAHDAAINIAANPTANVPTRGTGAGGNTRAQDAQTLADFFAQFARTQLPALSAAIYDINKRYDDAIKLAHGNAEALAKLNEQRAIEIRQAKEQARASAVSPAQAFIDSTLPSLVTQINAVHTGAQGLIDGLRAVAAQGGLSTAELHKLVAALRAAEAAQVAAIKSGILDSINQFAATLSNQGLTGQLANIATQALKLRESLNALAQAGTLTADEFFAAAGKLADAAKAQQQAAFDTSATSLLSQLYGYLHEDTKAAKLKFDLTLASLQIQEVQLEQAAALYGLVGDYIPEIKDLIERFRKAGPGILASGSSGTNFTDPATVLALAAQNQANAATTLSNAAQAFAASTDKLIAYQQSLLTNPSLSPLTPDQQRAEALRQLQANYASGLAGNIDARNAFSGLADTFLRISKGVNPSTLGYGVDFQRVQDMLTRLIGQTSYQIPGTSNVYSGPFGSGGNGGLGTGSGAGGAGGFGGLGGNPASVIDLSPVVLSVQSSSNRNHEDLGMLNAQLTRLTSAVQEQQGKLSRIANYLERAA